MNYTDEDLKKIARSMYEMEKEEKQRNQWMRVENDQVIMKKEVCHGLFAALFFCAFGWLNNRE